MPVVILRLDGSRKGDPESSRLRLIGEYRKTPKLLCNFMRLGLGIGEKLC
jgi:hypothetical protein